MKGNKKCQKLTLEEPTASFYWMLSVSDKLL